MVSIKVDICVCVHAYLEDKTAIYNFIWFSKNTENALNQLVHYWFTFSIVWSNKFK